MQDDEEDTPQSMYKLLADRVQRMEESLDKHTTSFSVTRGMVSDLRDKTVEYDQLAIQQEQLEHRFTELHEQTTIQVAEVHEQMQQRFTSIEEQLQSLLAQP